MRVVLDTNVIISRYLTPRGRVAWIIDLWEQGAFELLTSEAILSEYSRMLRYPRLVSIYHLTDAQLSMRRSGNSRSLAYQTQHRLWSTTTRTMIIFWLAPTAAELIASSPAIRTSSGLAPFQGIPILSAADFLAHFDSEWATSSAIVPG